MAIDLFQADELVSRANVNQRLTTANTDITSVDTKFSPVQLYYNASGSSGTIELSDNIKNYQMIEICFFMSIYSSGLTYGANRIYNAGLNEVNTGLTLNVSGSYNSSPRVNAFAGNTAITDDSLTHSSQNRAYITGTNTTAVQATSTDVPKIYKIIGYKY